ncbi:MAG: prolyl oligopeptidase family serine peptidase [Planctomycetia bacterium]|nr:prolyl oligopeptidase family serine peptidase [Planctomycetia bacterium]
MDGYSAKKPQFSDEQCLQINFMTFQKAHAGVVNVRNVVEFASQKIPQVNPNQLFIVGLSSAATLALLAAAHEPRLKGAVAFAPVSDVESRLRETLNAPASQHIMPGVHHFARQSSPLSHVKRVACPVFLFHAADDGNVPVSDSRKFAELLKSNAKQVEYVEVPTGNHYDSMIQQGVPRAIPWLKQLASQAGSNAFPVVAQNQAPSKQNAGVMPNLTMPLGPLTNLPQNTNAGGQPSGRVVTFRFQSFGGQGNAVAAARQALRGVAWADPNDIEVDAGKGEIRIGQLGGSVNTGMAQQALSSAGFQMLPGVSIGSKSALVAEAQSPPIRNEKVDTAKPVTVPSQVIPDVPVNKPPVKAETPKSKPTPVTPPSNPPEKRPEREKARRVVTFKYERFTEKGSSANAMKEALKKVDWADQNDLVIDATKKEIRIGLLAESPNFDQARKSLTTQGFIVAPGVTTATTKD